MQQSKKLLSTEWISISNSMNLFKKQQAKEAKAVLSGVRSIMEKSKKDIIMPHLKKFLVFPNGWQNFTIRFMKGLQLKILNGSQKNGCEPSPLEKI